MVGGFVMPVTNIRTKWDSGNLVFFDEASGNTVLELDATTLAVSIPGTLTSGGTAVSGAFPSGGRFTVVSDVIANADFPLPFFIAPAACYFVSAKEAHITKATTNQTLQLEKLTAGTAPGSGTGMLASSAALDNTNDTPQTLAAGALTNLAAGDRVGLRTSGGSATYAGGMVVGTFQWV
jgi:hypothetical protein